jgi:hypothetical protein
MRKNAVNMFCMKKIFIFAAASEFDPRFYGYTTKNRK